MQALLEVNDLSYTFADDQGPILKDISFRLNTGEILGILGPNGGGKSTLLKILAQDISLKNDSFQLNGRPVSTYSLDQWRHLVSYLPQYQHFNEILPLTVEEFLDLSAHLVGRKISISPKEVLKMVGLESKSKLSMKHLSGGERQRILIARALLLKPKILLLDEPNAGLDSRGEDQIYHLVIELMKKQDLGVIIVDHNLGELIRHSNHILCLNRTQHWHNRKEILTQAVLEDIYHCEMEHLKVHLEGHSDHDHSHS